MGKTRVIAETGAGQHGVATATAAAFLGLECEVFMGEEDTIRQALNVYRMELLGLRSTPLPPVPGSLKTLSTKPCANGSAASTIRTTSSARPWVHIPFPMMVRDFQSVISKEARQQILEREGKLPSAVLACVGGGSNAMGDVLPLHRR